jgi:drug/metabolite transporter (DMT)-like permease
VLLAGIAAVSFASIFIRFAQGEGIPSLVIAAGRLTVATAILVPVTLLRHHAELGRLRPRDLALIAVAGVFLAVHFAAWVTSLEYTNVLISVVLVTSGPIWVALLEVLFLRARLAAGIVIGIAIAVVGGILIGLPVGGAPVEVTHNTLIGAGLALIGAITVSVYVIIGRVLRTRISIIPYIALVYGMAALLLLAALLATQTPISGYSGQGYLWILVMGLVPQLIGHSSFNYALGFLPATLVSVATQVEPIGSAVAAFILFREMPTQQQLLGSAVLIVGVLVAILGPGRKA